MPIFKKNVFGQYIFIKKNIIRFFGTMVYPRFNWINKPEISGAEHLMDLPDKKVLFVSNHQTYFADVSFLLHVFHSAIKGRPNNIRYPGYLWCSKTNIYYVAAEETMKKGFLPKLLAQSGAVTIKRSWRADGKNVRRKVDKKEVENIDIALNDGWVITFPQGTTSPYVPGRIGTAILVKRHEPIVVPIVIDGFRRAFDKKGLKLKKRKTTLKVRVKPPMDIDFSDKNEDIMKQIMNAIEQTETYDIIEKIKKDKMN